MVRATGPGGYSMTGGPGTSDPGHLTCLNITLSTLLSIAFNLTPDRAVGAPSLSSARYDIIAKIPPATTGDQMNLMLQNLLVERFHLQFHRDMKEETTYILSVAKSGLRMQVAKEMASVAPPQDSAKQSSDSALRAPKGPDGCPKLLRGGKPSVLSVGAGDRVCVSARSQPVSTLTRIIGHDLGRPVVDATGLTGTYDFDISFVPDPRGVYQVASQSASPQTTGQFDPTAAVVEAAPSLQSALQNVLGLRLQSQKESVEVLVVDHVGSKPTEN